MSDVRELKPEPVEIKLINPRRTSLMPAENPKHVDPAPTRRKPNRAICGIEIAAAVSLLLNVIQSVIIYVLQAGPIRREVDRMPEEDFRYWKQWIEQHIKEYDRSARMFFITGFFAGMSPDTVFTAAQVSELLALEHIKKE